MQMYNHEKEKSQLLQSLLSQAKRKGYIQSDTIVKRFNKYKTSEAELEDIFSAFSEAGIEIVYNEEEAELYVSGSTEEDETSSDIAETKSSEYYNSLNTYIREIHEFPTLSHKDTLALVKRILSGDMAAREYLINCNLKFAFSVASKYVKTGLPLLDLIQQANIGLINATDRYNPNRGTRFTTYCVFWIRQSILRYIDDYSRMIRLPRHISADLTRIKNAKNTYYVECMQYPTDSQIADITGLSIARVKQLQNFDFTHVSTDTQPDEDMGGIVLDSIASDENEPDANIHSRDCLRQIGELLGKLSERERIILTLHYGLNGEDPLNLEEIGCVLNLTRERIRQIESKALNKLRNMPGIANLYDYLNP